MHENNQFALYPQNSEELNANEFQERHGDENQQPHASIQAPRLMQGNNSGGNATQLQGQGVANAENEEAENQNNSHSSNENDDGAEADAEADDDAGANLKPDFDGQGVPSLMPLAQRINKPTGFSNAVCNFNSHV